MRLLVLGGTHHVGRAVVEMALARGDDVTTLTRGVSGLSAAGALALHGDRTDPAAKRGGELAALAAFGNRALLARAGLILGPYEIVGRMPWWLGRIERGGDMLAPGPPDQPLQYIDCRDLAAWMLSMADRGQGGIFDTVSEPGHTTMAGLLETAIGVTGSDARLVWVAPGVIEAAGIEAWMELPIWA